MIWAYCANMSGDSLCAIRQFLDRVCIRIAFASSICPLLSMHPHPASELYEVGWIAGKASRYVIQTRDWKSLTKSTWCIDGYVAASSVQTPPCGCTDAYLANRSRSEGVFAPLASSARNEIPSATHSVRRVHSCGICSIFGCDVAVDIGICSIWAVLSVGIFAGSSCRGSPATSTCCSPEACCCIAAICTIPDSVSISNLGNVC